MENLSFEFDKFVEDIEKRESAARERAAQLQMQQREWSARRMLDQLYREKTGNRIFFKK